jgi:hypothetical protein
VLYLNSFCFFSHPDIYPGFTVLTQRSVGITPHFFLNAFVVTSLVPLIGLIIKKTAGLNSLKEGLSAVENKPKDHA